jgi:hypothetical protein
MATLIRPLFADMDILCGHISSAASLVNRLYEQKLPENGDGVENSERRKKVKLETKKLFFKMGDQNFISKK